MWTISNSKQRFSPNILRNAVIKGTKNCVLGALADWIELTPQTASALTTTFRAHTVFIDDLSVYQYVLDCRVIQLNDVPPVQAKQWR